MKASAQVMLLAATTPRRDLRAGSVLLHPLRARFEMALAQEQPTSGRERSIRGIGVEDVPGC